MVREEKVEKVKEIKELLQKYSTLVFIDIFKLPSKPLQDIRKELRDKAIIKVVKKSILKFALKELEGGEELEKLIPQQPAIALTNLNPFKFYSLVSKLTSRSFAKEGDIAPFDIKISAGPTSLMPGPVISELSKAGIPVGVEGGKIAVKKDVVVAKKGERISRDLANALRKLGIQPMEIKLNVVAIYENGNVYQKEVLELVNLYPQKIKECFSNALNFSINIGFPTKENIKYLLIKAHQHAKAIELKIGGVK